jgi:hypothetical protein
MWVGMWVKALVSLMKLEFFIGNNELAHIRSEG